MSRCHALIRMLYQMIAAGVPIDDVLPYDLDAFTPDERIEIWTIGAVHLHDPKRRAACRKKALTC